MLAETGLSYFGFGVQPPDVSLGTLIADGTESAQTFPWLFLTPAVFLVIFVLAVNVVGDGLRDALDPNSSGGRRKEKRAARKEQMSGGRGPLTRTSGERDATRPRAQDQTDPFSINATTSGNPGEAEQ